MAKKMPIGRPTTRDPDKTVMDRETAGLKTKAEKIRALDVAGFARADIARYLDIRYQHVRNTLVRGAPSKGRAHPSEGVARRATWSKLGPGGRIVIPAVYRDALGLREGDDVQLRFEDEEIHILPKDVVARRVQDIVAKYVPEGVSLVDELIEERKREAEFEERSV